MLWESPTPPGGAWIDRVGWTVNAHAPALYEGTPIIRSSPLQDGEQFVRKTSTNGVSVGPGRAYDSGSNNIDFVDANPAIYPPRNTEQYGHRHFRRSGDWRGGNRHRWSCASSHCDQCWKSSVRDVSTHQRCHGDMERGRGKRIIGNGIFFRDRHRQ